MNKKYIFTAVVALLSVSPIVAQETYENANIVTEDLNGTARYVGMGGAMDALGADISTISSNPAGIGLFRSSQITATGGISVQGDAKDFANASKAHANFDQLGFVWAKRTGQSSFFNFAFNYHKSRDFNYILSAAQSNLSQLASQNAQSYIKAVSDGETPEVTGFGIYKDHGNYYGDAYWTSQIDNLYYNTFILNNEEVYGYNLANGYAMNRSSKGYIGNFDFNISGNINDRVYLGLTVGIKDVNYRDYSEYTDYLVNVAGASAGSVTVCDERKIDGTGFDLKFGAIVRPVEDSPFRLGLSIATPTFYDLTTTNYTTLINNTDVRAYKPNYTASDSYDFRLNSPWKFGFSLGHTVANCLAIGVGYEYADYGATSPRIKNGDYYDFYYDTYYDDSYKDEAMKEHTEQTLKGVSTFKLGLEFKPVPELALRAGYNYVSPMYKTDGFKESYLDSYGTNVSSTTDYTNWKSTNRLTLGVGFSSGKFFGDLAYQYSAQKGDFYPYMDSYVDERYYNNSGELVVDQIDNYATKTEVNNNRHQFMLTFGYRF